MDVIVSGKPVGDLNRKPTKSYRLKDGKKHIHLEPGGGGEVKPGDEVQLTEDQAKAFADKFEAVDHNEEFAVKTDADLVKIREAQVGKKGSTPRPAGDVPPPKSGTPEGKKQV